MNKKSANGLKVLVNMLSTVVVASIILLSLITLLVFNREIVIKYKSTRTQKNWVSIETYINVDEEVEKEKEGVATIEFRFIDKNGNYFEMDNNVEKIQPHCHCRHSWQLGTVTKHKKFNNRACENTLHNSSKCLECGDIRVYNEFEFHKYAVCPH